MPGLIANARAVVLLVAALPMLAAAQSESELRGEYLVHAGGCITCHTKDGDDAKPLAGGRALVSRRRLCGVFPIPAIGPCFAGPATMVATGSLPRVT